MPTAAPKPMSLERFLAWEREQPERWEFDGQVARMMTGGRLRHGIVQRNVLIGLQQRLSEPCQAFGSDLKVIAAGERVYYPDASVTCASTIDETDDIVPDPVAVFEVTSPSSKGIDRGRKRHDYAATPSIRHYVVIDAEERQVEHFRRGEDGAWSAVVLNGLADAVELPELGVSLPLSLLYAGTKLAA
jgi:Uma2 family endonuclease